MTTKRKRQRQAVTQIEELILYTNNCRQVGKWMVALADPKHIDVMDTMRPTKILEAGLQLRKAL